MRKQVFKAIADTLAALPAVSFVDLWNNQVQTLNGGTAFPLPAVFVEFEALEWRQQGNGARRGHTDPNISRALEVFDILDGINAAMQDLRGENFSGFMLTTSATNHDHAEIIENVERYICDVQDITAMRQFRCVSVLSVAVSQPD